MRLRLLSLLLLATTASAVMMDSRRVNLLASAARTASGTGDFLSLPGSISRGTCVLDVTAQAGTTPTLDVYLQGSPDAAGTVDDMGHFDQVGAATGKQVLSFNAEVAANAASAADEVHAARDGTLAAGDVVQGPFGDRLRVKYTLGGTSPSYTFSVTCYVTG